MKQAALVGARRFEIREVARPEPGPGEVLVKVEASGVCASELESWRSGAPALLGHEVAGSVVALGHGVLDVALGERVTGLFTKGFADYALTSVDRVLPIPASMRYAQAFGEPLACAVSGARRTRVELGDSVAVIGLGFMGLLMLQLMRLKGPGRLIGIDMREDVLAMATRLGADEVMKPDEIGEEMRLTRPKDGRKGPGLDVVVEATGTQPGLTLAGELIREHGFLSILGYHQGGQRAVDMQLWNFKAIDVLNAHERRPEMRMDCMRRGLDLAASGRLDLACLTTHRFSLSQVGDAFAALDSKPEGFIKSVIMTEEAG